MAMWYIILQVIDVGEFKIHIFVTKFMEKLRSLNPTEKLFFIHKLQEKRVVHIFCRIGRENLFF